jgi:hypothetical protein
MPIAVTLLAAAALASSEPVVDVSAPPTLARQVQSVTITHTDGNCDVVPGYKYQVYFRPDNTFQTREMNGLLTDSGTCQYRLARQPHVAIVEYQSYPPSATAPSAQWYEVMGFDTQTIEGTQVGTNCTYKGIFTMAPY